LARRHGCALDLNESVDAPVRMATEEQNKEVLEAVLDGIGRRGSPAGALTLLRSTNHLSPEIRRTVAAYLPSVVSKKSGDRITDSLINLSQDDDEDVRDWGYNGVGHSADLLRHRGSSPNIRDTDRCPGKADDR
jgi:hypothetical protein